VWCWAALLVPDLAIADRLAIASTFADAAPERAMKVLVYRAPA